MTIEEFARKVARADEAYFRAYDAERHSIREERAKERMMRIERGLEKPFEFNLWVPEPGDTWSLGVES